MYRIGIDLGGTTIKVGLVDWNDVVIDMESCMTKTERPWKNIIHDMAKCVQRLLVRNHITVGKLLGIGVGSPGTVDSNTGTVLYSNNFSWTNIPFIRELTTYYPVPINMSNDANCAALGEVVAGVAKGKRNVVLLTLGTGVGSGIIIDGKIYEGSYPGASEIGHTVIHMNGEPCTCGRKGCFEAYASATALIRQATRNAYKYPDSLLAEKMKLDNLTGKDIFELDQKGDLCACLTVSQYIEYLACGITNVINVFRCDMIVLSGGISNASERILTPLNEKVQLQAFGTDKGTIAPIVRATLGNQAGMVGAANLINKNR